MLKVLPSCLYVLRTVCGPGGRSIPCFLTPGSRLTELLWNNYRAGVVTEEKQALYGFTTAKRLRKAAFTISAAYVRLGTCHVASPPPGGSRRNRIPSVGSGEPEITGEIASSRSSYLGITHSA